jgi:hypothetical protein
LSRTVFCFSTPIVLLGIPSSGTILPPSLLLISSQIVFHLDFLLSNPNIAIHYGFNKKNIMTGVLPQSLLSYLFFDLIGISRSRLVSGPIQVTEYALLPREGGCQDAAYNNWELQTMRETLLKIADKHHSTTSYLRWESSRLINQSNTPHDCNILLLYRTMTKYSQNLFDKKRRFPQMILDQLVALLQESHTTETICSKFHGSKLNLQIFSDADELLMRCIPCQIKLFSQAHLVIGVSDRR